jgi:hypothetical protein
MAAYYTVILIIMLEPVWPGRVLFISGPVIFWSLTYTLFLHFPDFTILVVFCQKDSWALLSVDHVRFPICTEVFMHFPCARDC